MKTAALLLVLVISSSQAFAVENLKTKCRYEGNQRIIEVLYTGDGNIPCVVQYTKENSTESLWRAEVEIGYCEEKAANFITKHEGWGWQCQQENNSAQTE